MGRLRGVLLDMKFSMWMLNSRYNITRNIICEQLQAVHLLPKKKKKIQIAVETHKVTNGLPDSSKFFFVEMESRLQAKFERLNDS